VNLTGHHGHESSSDYRSAPVCGAPVYPSVLPEHGSLLGHRHVLKNTGCGKWLQHVGSPIPSELEDPAFPNSKADAQRRFF
jgi:hypothetical protein